jgi:hypothetical protein
MADRPSRLAPAVSAAAVACWIAVIALIGAAPGEAVTRVASIGIGEGAGFAVAWTAFAIVGAIIVRRRPGNAIGWLCSLGGLQVGAFALLTAFATLQLSIEPGSQVGVASAWLSHTLVTTLITFPLLIMLRFPTGRLIGPGWQRAEQASLLVILALVVAFAIEPMPLLSFPTTPNPVAIGSARVMAFGSAVVAIIWLIPVGSGVAALVVRYRRGSAIERLQIRWLAAASVVVGCAAMSMPLTSPDLAQGRMSTASSVAFALGFSTIPMAIGIAVVRHQLYDIDRLVKRTLVYALASATLAVVYGAAVVALSAPLTALLPAAGDTLTTAASTLLVAALFRPVRSRAQGAVDRRFDRDRHEAAGMVEAFAGRIRAEVELDGIVGDLLGATGGTVHPTSSGFWLRSRPAAGRALLGSPEGTEPATARPPVAVSPAVVPSRSTRYR